MMLNLLYDLIFTLPILPIIYSVASRFFEYDNGVTILVCMAVEVVIFLAFNLRKKWKLLAIVPAVIIVFTVGIDYELLIVTLVALLAFGIGFFTKRYPIFNCVIAAGVIVYFVLCMVNKITLPIILIVCGFIVIMTAFFSIINHRWKRKGSSGHKKYLVAVAPFIILPTMFTLVLPKPDAPYDWSFFMNLYNNIVTSTDSAFNSVEFDKDVGLYSGVGFSSEGSFGGDLVTSNREMMRIALDKRYNGKLYLTGKVFDSFEDMRWVVNNPSNAKDVALDTYETMEAAKLLGDGKIGDYLSSNRVQFDYTYTRSEYTFAPAKATPYNDKLDSLGVVQEDGGLKFDGKKGHGTKYYVEFYEINQDAKFKDELICSTNVIDEAVWEKDNFSTNTGSKKGLSYQDLLSHRANIYDVYTDKPVISDQMKAYLDDLFSDCDTIQKKLDRLQSTLQEYSYTLTPGPLPEWVKNESDFLDYFCLDSREGYCSYFATAFALIARYEGIPTRYIQGYAVPQNKSDITVTCAMAHAWPEVYYENVGWIAYEPTPGYEIITTWKKKDPNKVSVHSTYEKTPDIDEKGELVTNRVKEDLRVVPAKSIGIIVGVIICLACLFVFVDFLVRRLRWNRLSDKDKLISICHKAIYVLKKCGYSYSDRMTLREFKVLVLDGEIFTGEEIFLLDIFESLSYCDGLIFSLEDGLNSYKMMMAKAKDNMPLYRYIFMKIRLISI